MHTQSPYWWQSDCASTNNFHLHIQANRAVKGIIIIRSNCVCGRNMLEHKNESRSCRWGILFGLYGMVAFLDPGRNVYDALRWLWTQLVAHLYFRGSNTSEGHIPSHSIVAVAKLDTWWLRMFMRIQLFLGLMVMMLHCCNSHHVHANEDEESGAEDDQTQVAHFHC